MTQQTDHPSLSGLNHFSVPVRDTDEAVRFWTEIFGAEVALRNPLAGFAEVRVGGVILGLATQKAGWTGRTAEFPHYGFTVRADHMKPLKARLETYGVPTHEIWTRNRKEALMYFRDPSGNLFEFYCPAGFEGAESLPNGGSNGGTYKVDLAALNYETWKDPGR